MSSSDPTYDDQLTVAGAELERLIRRLQSLSGLAWRSRREPVAIAAARLAEIGSLAEQRAIPALPELENYAYSDVIAVVAGDALAALTEHPDAGLLADLIAVLREVLDATR